MSEAAAIKSTLIDRCEKHPAGPFCLKFAKISYVSQSFHFLGYRVKYSTQPYGKFAMACPPQKAFDTLFNRVRSRLKNSTPDNLEHRGLLNLILQIETILFEEFERRSLSNAFYYLDSEQIEGVLAKFGHADLATDTIDTESDSFTQYFNFPKPTPVSENFLGISYPDYITHTDYKG